MDTVFSTFENLATVIDIVGILIILYGFTISLVKLVRVEFGRISGKSAGIRGCQHVRLELGTYILVGIEFMIASDIIGTVISKTLESLIFVTALVVIRTAISFFLGRELAEVEAIAIKQAR